jgi:glycolate oxidase iron-sulfur subunit
MLVLDGCVRPPMGPNMNVATARVLDAPGVQVVVAPKAGCCCALRFQMNDLEGGLDDMRRSIDAWRPLAGQVEAIVITAAGCSGTVKQCAHLNGARPRLRGEGAAEFSDDAQPVGDRAAVRSGTGRDTEREAGTFSVLQPGLLHELRDRKLANQGATGTEKIVSANIGRLTHLQSGSNTPFTHWIELIDRALRQAQASAQ